MLQYLKDLWNTLTDWLLALLGGLVDALLEIPLLIFKGLLAAIAAVINLIPVPSFAANGLGYYFGLIPNDVGYFLSRSGIHEALAILGLAIVFRLTRKVVTLFQW